MSQQNINVKGAAKGLENHVQNRGELDFDTVYEFLKSHYKPSRFAERDQPGIWHDYSSSVTRSHIDSLKQNGISFVSHHEDKAGNGFKFNAQHQIYTQ